MRVTRRLALALAAVGLAMLLASGVAAAANLFGTSGDDTLKGTESNDVIYGLRGNDSLEGLGGDDTLNGHEGQDRIYGGAGKDTIYGNDDNDDVGDPEANKRFDGLYGGSGADVINGNNGNDRIVANDRVDEEDGSVDRVYGGSGDDLIFVSSDSNQGSNDPGKPDEVFCSFGNDVVHVDDSDKVYDCETVVNDRDEVEKAQRENNPQTAAASIQSESVQGENATGVRDAIAKYEKHLTVGSDGEFELDKEGVAKEDVDPATRDMLESSLEETNRKIRAGEMKASDVFPSPSKKTVPTKQTSVQSGDITIQACSGENSVEQGVFGTYYSLDSCNTLALQTALGTGSLLTLNPELVPLGVVSILGATELGIANSLGGLEGVTIFDPYAGPTVVYGQ